MSRSTTPQTQIKIGARRVEQINACDSPELETPPTGSGDAILQLADGTPYAAAIRTRERGTVMPAAPRRAPVAPRTQTLGAGGTTPSAELAGHECAAGARHQGDGGTLLGSRWTPPLRRHRSGDKSRFILALLPGSPDGRRGPGCAAAVPVSENAV